jgi:aerobic carbon-monoxide dehydrogenase medium subunit
MYYYRRMPKFDYLAPKSIDEVSSLLQQHKGEARIMAGGTIVLHRMKERIAVRPYVIGIQAVAGLDSIVYDGKTGLKIGAMAKLEAIAESADVKKGCALLSTVCALLGTPQIRNMGTIGGNVASRLATAETVPALIALAAEVKVLTATGEKTVAMEDLYKELKDGDFIMGISVPPPAAKTTTGYKKFAVRERFDYATVAAATVMRMEGKTCKDIKIGLGGVTLQTMRAKAAEEALKDQALTDALIEKAASIAADSSNVGSDVMFSAEYKKKVLKTMVKRALKEAAGEVLK